MAQYKRFAFDVGLTFFASSTSILLGFGVSVLLGRALGANDLGLYKMVSTIYGLAFLGSSLGIPATIIKFVSEDKENRKRIDCFVSSAIVTSAILSLVFVIGLYCVSGLLESVFALEGLGRLLRLISPVFPFALLGGTLLGLLNGLREMKKFALAVLLQGVLMLTISVTMILAGQGLDGVVIAIIISTAGSFSYLCFACREYFSITLHRYAETTGRIVKFGSQVFSANIVNMINYQGGLMLVGFFLTAAHVGYYGVAVGLGQFFWLFPQAVQRITYPAISEHWKKQDLEIIRKIVDKTTKYAAFVLLPAGLMVGLFAAHIIEFIFGNEFGDATLPLRIILIGTVVNGVMQRPIGSMLFSIGAPNLNLRIFAGAAAVNIALNVMLIPVFGIAGAAIAGSASLLMITALVLLFINKVTTIRLNWHWFGSLALMTLPCLFSIAALSILNLEIIGILPIGILALAIWCRLFENEDRIRITGLVRTGIQRMISRR